MGNSASVVFPQPVSSSGILFPSWAIAVVVAAAIVSLLWVLAIICMVVYQVIENSPRKSKRSAEKCTVIVHSVSSASLGTPPPPIPPPSHPSPAVAQSQGATLVLEDVADNSDSDDVSHKPVVSDSYDTASQSSDSSSNMLKPVVQGCAAVAGVTDVNSEEDDPTNQDHPLAGMVLSRPVTVRQLGATIREPSYIETEFRKLPTLTVSSNDLPLGTARKNRYTNVLPTPKTRVELPLIFGHPNSEYINANYIRGHKGCPRQYIATQGPLQSTIEDFWRMVLDNNSSVVIMATNFQERGIEKCSRYWPAQGSQEYGNIQVTLLQQTAHGTYNTSTLCIQPRGGVAKTVTHYRLTFWPHQGVPRDTKTLTDFLRQVKMADSSGPAVVHCSSGIGRTSVLLACDIGMQGFLQGDPKVDVLRIVSTMRQDRAGMVQTREQYRFIHQALYNFVKEEYAK